MISYIIDLSRDIIHIKNNHVKILIKLSNKFKIKISITTKNIQQNKQVDFWITQARNHKSTSNRFCV